MVWTCQSCTIENESDSAQRCDCCGEPRQTLTQQAKSSPWTCGNCTIENEPSAERCDCCGEPRKTLSDLGVKVDDDDDDDVPDNLRDSTQGGNFEAIMAKRFAAQTKGKILALGEEAKKKYPHLIGICDEAQDTLVIRGRVDIDFVDDYQAKIWGLDPSRPVIIDFRFNLEDFNKAPHFQLYQSGDTDLSRNKMKEISSFGLEWQLRARMGDWLNGANDSKVNWPPRNDDWFFDCLREVRTRIANCIKSCIICDGPLGFEMIKPSVCDNKVCTFSHEQYGLGADVASELRDNHTVVDLLLTLAYAGAGGDVKRFNPFPVGCEARTYDSNKRETVHSFMRTETDKDAQKVIQVLDAMPQVETLRKYKDTRQIKEFLEGVHPLAFPLLRWSITSNRAHLARLDPEDRIKEMGTEFQYMFLSSPPEKEAEFQKLKKEKGSFWAFHGSGLSNWHCILRVGLKNYSNTEFMSCGAAYGAGIYLSPHSSTSSGYAYQQNSWGKSGFGKHSLQCIALCEVINAGYKANPHYVIPNEQHVMTRYFFIFNDKFHCPSVESTNLKPKNPIEKYKAQSKKKNPAAIPDFLKQPPAEQSLDPKAIDQKKEETSKPKKKWGFF